MFAAAPGVILLMTVIVIFTPLECHGEVSLRLGSISSDLEFDRSGVRAISLPPGFNYTVICQVKGVGDFSETPWTKDSVPVDEAGTPPYPRVYYESKDNSEDLYITNFDDSLVGNYTCSDSKGENKTLIILSGNPSIILEDALKEYSYGDTPAFLIRAFPIGDPVPTFSSYQWLLDGVPIQPGVSTNGLTISLTGPNIFQFVFSTPVSILNDGVYTLIVNSTAGTASDSFTILVSTLPSIMFEASCSDCLDDSNTLRIPLSSNFTLSCTDTESNPRPVFTWFKDGKIDPLNLLEFDQIVTQETITTTESTIMFHKIPRDYAGTYGCKANNSNFKDFKEVKIIVEFTPVLVSLSPSTIDVLVGDDIDILILFDGGSPIPSFNWTYTKDLTTPVQLILPDSDSRIILSGNYSLNLTLNNVTRDDGGIYTLTAENTMGKVTLEFTVNVQFPPQLHRQSEITVRSARGGAAVFEVGVTDANPPVTVDDFKWTGQFESSKTNITYVNNVVILRLENLVQPDTGSVTLTVSHTAGDIAIVFELIVLNLPMAPVSVDVTTSHSGTCDVMVEWELPDSTSNTLPVDTVVVEYRACAYDDQSCDLPWQLDNMYPTSVSSSTVSLMVDSVYTFRLAGCSDGNGCGMYTVVEKLVETNVDGFQPIVSNFILRSINSSSISIEWQSPADQSDCYDISRYDIICSKVNRNELVYNVSVSRGNTDSYTLVLNYLEPDTSYNCSASILYEGQNGNMVQLDISPAYASGYTLPQLTLEKTFDVTINQSSEATPSLDLSKISGSFDLAEVSFIHIIVLRLGNSPTVPDQPPDIEYPSISDFSTYAEVHSEHDSINYKPYIAAQFEPDNIPKNFVIGSDDVNDNRKRQEYTNGPLESGNYYTFFVRVYASSKFNEQEQVFYSSSYTSPFQSTRSGSSGGGSSSGSGSSTVAIVVVVLLIIAAVVSAISIVIILYFRHKRGKRQTIPLDDTNGHAMNEYSNIEEVKGRGSMSPSPVAPPQPPSTDPPKTKPIMATTNALFDSEEQSSSITTTAMDNEEDKRSLSIHMDCSSTPSSVSPTPCHGSRPTSPLSLGGKRKWSNPVDRDMFQGHLDRLDENDQRLFEKEFLYIQTHSTEHPAEASNRAFMHGKNRYKNVTAFDHTRVVLSRNSDDPNCDYINANYIKGYDEHKLYIATQGPTEETHVDFWRMVWEQRTTTIVMLTNLEEKGKPKCFKYWPSQGGKAYGNIVVRKDRDIVLPYYVIRSFKLIDVNRTISDGDRTVIQFHYTAWPDKNVPAQASPLLDFLRAINIANDAAKHGPMIVHCSAGVGRTGTIIALDICLDQLKTEGQADVGSVVSFLREQRTQMVQTMSQYIFIHHAILEDIVYGDSTVLLKTFPEKYLKLQASHCALIKDEYDRIGLVKPPAQANSNPKMVCTEKEDQDGKENSFPGFIVDGYWYHNLFIACPMCPTPENEELFWRLIWQEHCSHIINMSQKSHGLYAYLPDTGATEKFGELQVTVEKMEYKTGYILRHITIATEQCKETVSVKHMQYEDWLSKQMPKTDKLVRFLLEVIHETHTREREGHPILVHDSGSMSQVGTFITLLNCCERIKKERLVDLLQTVNRLHLQCPKSVSSMELNHYAYCYDCIREYCDKLQRETSEPPIYENIASIRGRLQPSPEPIQSDTVKYLNDYEILDESILGSIANQDPAVSV